MMLEFTHEYCQLLVGMLQQSWLEGRMFVTASRSLMK